MTEPATLAEQLAAVTARAEQAEAALTAVRAEHARDDSNPLGPWCGTCIRHWPCATASALDGHVQ